MQDPSGANRRVIKLHLRLIPIKPDDQRPAQSTSSPVALLIDGENIFSSHLVPEMLEVAAKLGNVTVCRVYGNWRNNLLDLNWREACIKNGLQAAHSIKGKEKEKKPGGEGGNGKEKPKNGSDISLVIGALDLLNHNGIKHFCLVTGDSDYLPLIMRLREAGCTVIGIGKPDTYQSLRMAFNEFFTTDDLEVVHSSVRSKTAPLELTPTVDPNLNGAGTQSASAPPQLEASPPGSVLTVPLTPEETLDELLVRAYRRLLDHPKYKDLPENEKWIYNQDFGHSLKELNKDYQKAYEAEIRGKKLSDYLKKRDDLFEWRASRTPHQIEIKLRIQDKEGDIAPVFVSPAEDQ